MPYENISRVLYSDNGFFNTLFHVGTVTLELSGMKKPKVELEFIDNPEESAGLIQSAVRQAMLRKQDQFTNEQRIKKIVSGL